MPANGPICFVPDLGIRAADDPGLVMPQPVSVSRDGATLTITLLISSQGETLIRARLTDLPPAPGVDAAVCSQTRLSLSGFATEDQGRHPAIWNGGMLSSAIGPTQQYETFWRQRPLRPDVRSVDLVMEGLPPVGSWRLCVPVVPIAVACLSFGWVGGSEVTLHGITVRLAWVLADRERTAVQLVTSAGPPVRFVRGVGGAFTMPRAILRDDQGRKYGPRPFRGRPFPDAGGVHTAELLFPPLPSDVRSDEVVVPLQG